MSKFSIYTYQFSPIQTPGAGLFDDERPPVDELMAKKQEIFGAIIADPSLSFSFKNKEYGHKMLLNEMGISVLKIANQRNTTLEREFQKKKIEYAPSCFVIIDNRTNIQAIAIEDDVTAFYETMQVVNILQSTFNRMLKPHGLKINIQKAYQKTEFWSIINSHKNQVELVRFHFSYPNLPRVNQTIKEIISATSKSTNSKQSSFELKSAVGETLNLVESNEELKDLADYAAESGDEIEIKVKGIKSFIKTGSTTVSVEINDLETKTSKDLFQGGIEKIIEALNKAIKQ